MTSSLRAGTLSGRKVRVSEVTVPPPREHPKSGLASGPSCRDQGHQTMLLLHSLLQGPVRVHSDHSVTGLAAGLGLVGETWRRLSLPAHSTSIWTPPGQTPLVDLAHHQDSAQRKCLESSKWDLSKASAFRHPWDVRQTAGSVICWVRLQGAGQALSRALRRFSSLSPEWDDPGGGAAPPCWAAPQLSHEQLMPEPRKRQGVFQ